MDSKLSNLFLILKGGAGSGNFDHVGRSWKHGGSLPKGGGGNFVGRSPRGGAWIETKNKIILEAM